MLLQLGGEAKHLRAELAGEDFPSRLRLHHLLDYASSSVGPPYARFHVSTLCGSHVLENDWSKCPRSAAAGSVEDNIGSLHRCGGQPGWDRYKGSFWRCCDRQRWPCCIISDCDSDVDPPFCSSPVSGSMAPGIIPWFRVITGGRAWFGAGCYYHFIRLCKDITLQTMVCAVTRTATLREWKHKSMKPFTMNLAASRRAPFTEACHLYTSSKSKLYRNLRCSRIGLGRV